MRRAWLLLLAGCASSDPGLDLDDGPLLFPTLRAHVRLTDTADERAALGIEGFATGMDGEESSIDYQVIEVGVGARGGHRIARVFSANWRGGLAYHDVEFDARTDHGIGPYLGAEVEWQATPRFAFFAGLTGAYTDDTTSSRLDAGTRIGLAPFTAVEIGYRYWRIDQDLAGPDVELDVHGLVVGLSFDF